MIELIFFCLFYVVGFVVTIILSGITDNFQNKLDDGDVFLLSLFWPLPLVALLAFYSVESSFYFLKNIGRRIKDKIKNS